MSQQTAKTGAQRRVRNAPFESKFVDDKENWINCGIVFEIDRTLKQRIPAMGPALMRILLDRYPMYFNSTVVVPLTIEIATSEFIEQHNEDIGWLY